MVVMKFKLMTHDISKQVFDELERRCRELIKNVEDMLADAGINENAAKKIVYSTDARLVKVIELTKMKFSKYVEHRLTRFKKYELGNAYTELNIEDVQKYLAMKSDYEKELRGNACMKKNLSQDSKKIEELYALSVRLKDDNVENYFDNITRIYQRNT